MDVLSIHGALAAVLELSQMSDPLPSITNLPWGLTAQGQGLVSCWPQGLCPAGRVAALHWPSSRSPLPFYTRLVLSPLTA